MIDLDNYYLGVIIADSYYFNNPKRYRMIGNVNFDPFCDCSFEVAVVRGITTLLRYEDGVYYDEHFSRYKNELAYNLGVKNNLGIVLAYARPFTDFYDGNDAFYIKEEVEKNPELNEYIFHNYEYYISHSKLGKSDAVVLVDNMPMIDFHLSYYDYLIDKYDEKILEK